MIKILVNNVIASATELSILTAGMVKGRAIQFSFSDEWAELNKTAVFTNGIDTRIVPESRWSGDNIVYIPPEVLAVPNYPVKCGVYGISKSGEMIIPTIWVDIGRVFPSASPGEYPEPVPPTPNTWDDLQNQIGALIKLATENKFNLVDAINEVQGKVIDSRKELEEAKKAVFLLGGKIEEEVKFNLPDSDITRSLIKIKKSAATPKKYPRKSGLATKEPIKSLLASKTTLSSREVRPSISV